jgi:hypothetical protein
VKLSFLLLLFISTFAYSQERINVRIGTTGGSVIVIDTTSALGFNNIAALRATEAHLLAEGSYKPTVEVYFILMTLLL